MCQCEHFYVKDPEDEYNFYKFSCRDGDIRFEEAVDAAEVPKVHNETETYCIQCAWHGKFDALKSKA
jgi:hypothetical protein